MNVHVNTVRSQLNKMRQTIDTKHDVYYKNAVNVATENEIPIEKPRICTMQVNRKNYNVESMSDNYEVSWTIPFLDKLIESMNDRFTPKNIAIYSGFHILPGVMLKSMQWREQFKHFLKHYLRTITNLDNINAELDLWEHSGRTK